jgi:hypothetical protein
LIDRTERGTGWLEHRPATICQPDDAAVACEQRRTDLLLEAVDLLGESRLSEIEPLSGSAEVQLFR